MAYILGFAAILAELLRVLVPRSRSLAIQQPKIWKIAKSAQQFWGK
jgi:hypothetical protein